MLLSEILEDADLLVPNALTTKQKLRYFNQVQTELYRDFPMPVESITFTTTPGGASYSLPFPTERVRQVYVNDVEYEFSFIEDENYGKTYSFIDNKLFLQPTPTEALTGIVLYDGTPTNLMEGNLGETPAFLPDYHELFVLGIARRIAMVVQNYELAGELEVRFNNLLTQAKTKTTKTQITKIRQVRGWY